MRGNSPGHLPTCEGSRYRLLTCPNWAWSDETGFHCGERLLKHNIACSKVAMAAISANIKVAYWLTNNVDFDQCILEFYKPDDGQAGWIHVSYNEKGSNRKQILTFDGKRYDNGLPEMKWESGKVV